MTLNNLLTRPSAILFFLIVILLLHALATFLFFWYWTIWWFDMAMHFAGGFTMGLVFFTLANKFAPSILGFSNLLLLIACASFVALIGIGWEFYEFLYDVFISTRDYSGILQLGAVDTLSDLFFDLLGGTIAFLIYLSTLKKKLI